MNGYLLFYSAELQPYHLAGLSVLSSMPEYDVLVAEIGLRTHDNNDAMFQTYRIQVYQDTQPSHEWACSEILAGHFDIVFFHGFTEKESRQVARACRIANVTSVMLIDNSIHGRHRTFWKELIKKLFVPRMCDYFFVPGEDNAIYVQSLGVKRDRIWKGLYSADIDLYRDNSNKARKQSQAIRSDLKLPNRYFLYVGRFDQCKNLPRLLDSYGSYRRTVDNPWSLLLVGSGELHESISERNCPGIILPGYIQFTDMVKFLALASCLCLPSLWEHWGLVVLEATACGIPVLASSRCGSVPELVIDGWNGWTFEPEDTAKLSELLVHIHHLDDGKLREMGKRGQSLAEPYSARAWAEKLDYYIKQIPR